MDEPEVWDGFSLLDESEPPTIPPMTVCVGALCEDGKAAVLAADRCVSHTATGYRLEDRVRKITALFPEVLLATAGEPLSDAFLRKLKENRSSSRSVSEAGAIVSEACAGLWREKVSEAITQSLAGCDFSDFMDGKAKVSEANQNHIWGQIVAHKTHLSFLIACVDETEASLRIVRDQGMVHSLDSVGFGAVGVGKAPALEVLFQTKYDKGKPLAEAVYVIYEAKRAAEMHSAVDKKIDIAILEPKQLAYFLGDEEIKALARIYEERHPPDLSKDHRIAINKALATAKSKDKPKRGNRSHH